MRLRLTNQYQRLFEMEGADLTRTDRGVTMIAKKAIERGTGEREQKVPISA
ncbi:MAG: hypothetical protein IOC90_07405 [Methylocystis sp.]|nr:hypothetical protein [Methylocystis sp.]MCA3587844.1 hypothetical protein [Methylocystis sp.]MCA3590824.1 hypothetical protein [Methylocystis sp.]